MALKCIFFILFAFGGVFVYCQNNYAKYKAAYSYIDSIYKQDHNLHLNVCPIIRPIPIKSFSLELEHSNDSILLIDNVPFFYPLVDKNIDTIFKNANNYTDYLLFSKPFKNTLSVEFKSGEYPISQEFKRLPDEGISTYYLFLFDDFGKIKNVYIQNVRNN